MSANVIWEKKYDIGEEKKREKHEEKRRKEKR
jgi:hypothetical protein